MPIYLTESVAQRIVDRAMAIIGHNVNVMDRAGIIIGTGDQQRLHKVHGGALKVLESGQPYDIESSQSIRLKGVQPGINRPIRFHREIIGVAGITGHPKDVSHYADLVVMTAELMIENAAVLSEVHWNQRQRENIVSEMIHGEAEADDLFEVRTRKLSIDPHLPRVAILISMKNRQGKDLTVEEVEQIQSVLRQGHSNDLVALVCPTQMVLLHVIDTHRPWHPDNVSGFLDSVMQRMEGFRQIDCRLSLGRYIPGLKGIPQSYQSAQEALKLGLELEPDRRLYRYFDFQLDSLFLEHVDSWKGRELQKLTESLASADSRGILRKTLRQYIKSNADAHATTQKLHIHRNTLSYRLERIHQLTGRNPKCFQDLMFLHFSLRLWELKTCGN